MTTTRYFIIERDPDVDPAPPQPGPGGGLEGFGATPAGAVPPVPAPVKVATADLTAREAASERQRSGVRMVGAAMPIRLIAPLDDAPAAPAQPLAGSTWGITATQADQTALDGSGVTVAVLDTGIDKAHPAFAGANLADADIVDFTGSPQGALDLHGHGTHCAGTIFGKDVGGMRIGVARGIGRAMAGKVLSANGGDSAMLFDALQWASREGCNIVSMSLGFDFPGLVERLVNSGMPQTVAVSTALVAFGQNLRAFDTLMASFRAGEPFGRNMLVVAAAGNESERQIAASFRISASLPAAAGGVVSVAAYGEGAGGPGSDFRIAPFSNIDPQIAAPGVGVVSAKLGGGLIGMNGTSMACPHVAGLAALWWQKIAQSGETPTPDKVREKMFANAVTTRLLADEIDRGRGRALAPG